MSSPLINRIIEAMTPEDRQSQLEGMVEIMQSVTQAHANGRAIGLYLTERGPDILDLEIVEIDMPSAKKKSNIVLLP